MHKPDSSLMSSRVLLLLVCLLHLLSDGHSTPRSVPRQTLPFLASTSRSRSRSRSPLLGGKKIFSLLQDRPLPVSPSLSGSKVTPTTPTITTTPVHATATSTATATTPATTGNNKKALWYTKVFPIYSHEMLKFFSLSSMMFWIIFVFTMSRDTKDTLIVTNCGAEAIAFLKVYGTLPAATAFMVLYTRLANRVDSKTLFYVTLAPFFAFYSLFAFVLYPLRHLLHPLHWQVPVGGLAFPVNLLRHWTFSLYYVVSDLWGSAGIPLLFWSCANDLVSLEQSSRWYPLMALFGNLGPIFSGLVMTLASRGVSQLGVPAEDAFEQSLKVLTGCMVAAGGVISWLHHFVHSLDEQERDRARTRDKSSSEIITPLPDASTTGAAGAGAEMNSNTEELSVDQSPEASVDSNDSSDSDDNSNTNDTTKGGGLEQVKKAMKVVKVKKPKLSFFDSVQVLVKDEYLRNIALMVLSYGLTMEFSEIIWKSTVKKAYPSKTDYLAFMGRYSSLVGAASFAMMFVGAQVNQALGWRAAALTTPVMMAVLAVPFFASIILGGVDSQRSLLLAVYVGLLQNVLSKATKYAIFDPSKEMTYIPLSKEAKTQGKAAIDVLGARLGKSAGALALQLVVLLCGGSILAGAPVVASLFAGVIALWIGSVNSLSPMFLTKSMELVSRRAAAAN